MENKLSASSTRPPPQQQTLPKVGWLKRRVTPFLRLVVLLSVVSLFLFAAHSSYKEHFYTPLYYCHGSKTLYMPPDHRIQAAECQWDDSARPRMILYGTIKGTGGKTFADNDRYNPLHLMDRTLRNWASLPGVQPVVFTEDEDVIGHIEKINTEVEQDIATHGDKATYHSVIHYIRQFEHGTKVKRAPTYRGMLRAIVAVYPEADLFIFANADILFTRSLVTSAREVQRYYDCVVKPNNPLMHGIFVTGRRINVAPDAMWNPWTNKTSIPSSNIPKEWKSEQPWERAMLSLAQSSGKRQSPCSMDYFIYTRDAMDWNYELEENDHLIGGVIFDLLWLAASLAMMDRAEVFAVDASQTVLALHQNGQKNMQASSLTWQSFYNTQLTQNAGDSDYLLSNDRVLRVPFFTGTTPSPNLDIYSYKLQFYLPQNRVYIHRRNKCFSKPRDGQ